MFLILFIIGLAGFILMSSLSFLHIGALRHGHTPLHSGGAHHVPGVHGHHGALPHPHAPGGHAPAHVDTTASHPAPARNPMLSYLMISPLDVFAMALGAGAAGLIFSSFLPGFAWLAAILGAVLLAFGVVRPLLSLGTRFESKPSEGLEGMVAQEVQTVTGFDSEGRGLISVVLDGQESHVLARLSPADRAAGVVVHKGEQVVILEVDSARNLCTVTKQLS